MVQRSRDLTRSLGPAVPRILVTGDSVALTLAHDAPTDPGTPLAIGSAAMLGCGITRGTPDVPAVDADPGRCERWEQVWRRGIDVFHPEAIVLLTGTWETYDHVVDGRTVRFGSAGFRREVTHQLATAEALARSADARLILLTTPCFAPAETGAVASLGALAGRGRIRRFNGLLRRFAEEHPGSVTVIDLDALACPGGRFAASIDGITQRIDGVHFTPQAAQVIWSKIGPQIAALLRNTST